MQFRDPQEWKELIKKHSVLCLCGCGLLIFLLFWMISSPPDSLPAAQKLEKPIIEGVKEAVDPRAVWSESLSQDVKNLKQNVDNTLGVQIQTQFQEIEFLKQKIQELQALSQRTLETPKSTAHPAPTSTIKQPSNFVHLSQTFDSKEKKDTEDYVTSGSFARAVLLTGVVAETGTDASSSPQPILLRLVDHGIFSKGYKTKQIKEAVLIGACHGNISSERAVCRLESLSLMSRDGEIIERPVEGWLIGEDGRPGIKGDVIDKSTDVTRMAVLNGILGGIAGFFQNQATSSVYPISPFTGQTKALTGMDSLKAGASSGVGNALQKLADYAIKRAEQMNPVVVVGAGRVIDVVFKKGFQIKDVINNTPLKQVSSVSNNAQNTQTYEYKQALNSLQINKGDY